MAEQPQAAVQGLTCGICLDKVKQSKQLPCFHTFCRDCLEKHIKHSNNTVTDQGKEVIHCPQCRRSVPVPHNGVNGFPSSYFVMANCAMSEIESGDMTCGVCGSVDSAVGFCIECRKNLCMSCKELHKSDENTQNHHILVMGDGRKTVETMEMCEKHPSQELKFYCTECKVPVCTDCRQTVHYGHEAIDIAKAADLDRERLTDMVEELKMLVIKFKAAKEKADEARDRMKVNGEVVVGAVETRREEVKRMVEQMCDDGIKFVQEKMDAEKKAIQAEYEDIKEDHDLLLRSIQESEEVLRLSAAVQIVRVAKDISDVLERYAKLQAKELDEKQTIFATGIYGTQILSNFCGMFGFEPLKLRPAFHFETDHFVEFSLIPVSSTQAWVSYYTSEGSALVKYDFNGEKKEDIALKPDGNTRVVKLGREFLMTSKQERKLYIYKGKAEPLQEFADVGLPPRGMVLTQENQIVLCTSESNGDSDNALLVFSERGDLLQKVIEEDGKKIFMAPRYIAVNINGDICVSDKGASCVVILNRNFQVKARYIPPESLKLRSSFCPRGICCDKFGRIIVADGCNNKLHLLSAQGDFLRFLMGESDGIKWPRLVSTGPGDKLWVVCRGNVQVYDYLDN
ncbi:E3 ubiquitin-protein ligase TRIM71-like [Haliotis rubra]|uniref:E3 ubiquitin-protein ligase TRIM71-like n=1 Tax=Haliotis rubra TaxID=36100 RepID=UPI001EE5C944|nr:E3 ubiquitin-protein ligase TRIM71-like [Haliotis rubra]